MRCCGWQSHPASPTVSLLQRDLMNGRWVAAAVPWCLRHPAHDSPRRVSGNLTVHGKQGGGTLMKLLDLRWKVSTLSIKSKWIRRSSILMGLKQNPNLVRTRYLLSRLQLHALRRPTWKFHFTLTSVAQMPGPCRCL